MPAKFLQGILEMPKTYFTDFMVRPRSGTTERHRKKKHESSTLPIFQYYFKAKERMKKG